MTKIEAHQLAYDLWKWLFLNPECDKNDWHRWDEIENMMGNCPLCEYYSNKQGCVLNSNCNLDGCTECCDAYYRWVAKSQWLKKISIDTRKISAAWIAAKIRRKLKKIKTVRKKSGLKDKNSKDLKSYYNHIAWIEEAHAVSRENLEKLEPTISKIRCCKNKTKVEETE